MKAELIEKCRLCGNSNLNKTLTTEIGYWSLASDNPSRKRWIVDLGYCDDCGHGQLLTDLTKEQIADMYLAPSNHRGPTTNYLDGFSSDSLPDHLDILSKFVDRNSRILDVGCNQGYLLAAVHKFADTPEKNILGLDFIDTRSWHFPFEKIDINDQSSLVNMSGNHKEFQMVAITNVLEHVLDPITVLSGVRNFVSDDGVLLVEVPNSTENISSSRLLSTSMVHPHHTQYFTPDSLLHALNRSGFTPVEYRNWDYADWLSQQIVCRKKNDSHLDSSKKYLEKAKTVFNHYDERLFALIEETVETHGQIGLWDAVSKLCGLQIDTTSY